MENVKYVNSFEKLPNELWVEIISYLSNVDFCSFMTSCKTSNTILFTERNKRATICFVKYMKITVHNELFELNIGFCDDCDRYGPRKMTRCCDEDERECSCSKYTCRDGMCHYACPFCGEMILSPSYNGKHYDVICSGCGKTYSPTYLYN